MIPLRKFWLMETHQKLRPTGSGKNPGQDNGGYTVLVPLQDIALTKSLLPPAIRAAKRHNGKIILLSIIEIPYQLPPSEAEQFKLEKEFLLQYALQIIETAGCDGEIMVRIAHRLPYAIEQLASSLPIDLIVMWAKNKGLLWDKQIYQKLYDVNCNLLIAKEQVETHFEEVILQVDEPQTARSMMEQATYLLGSEEGTIHIIPDYSADEEQAELQHIRSTVDTFCRKNDWFNGKTIIHQVQPKFATRKYLHEMYHQGTGSTCVLVPYSSGKKSKADHWLENEAKELSLPVFLSKVGRVEFIGIDQFAHKLKHWIGNAS